MAIYHFHVGIVSRRTGRSTVAAAAYRSANKLRSEYDGLTHDYSQKSNAVNAAAYRSGEKLNNERDSVLHDYTRKRGVIHSEIILPKNAPQEYKDRATLWNAVEKSEKRKDAQTARDIDMALPIELDRQEQIQLVREYVQTNFVDKGMCADFAIHDKQDGNPHAHILLTTRDISEIGFGKKNRDWNGKAYLEKWRENWSNACNEKLKSKGLNERIDHRTLKAQGIDREPTIHIGVAAKHMEHRGIEHNRAKENREIIARNENKKAEKIAEYMHKLKERHFILDKEITQLQRTTADARREMSTFRARAEEITERSMNIQTMKGQLNRLKIKRQGMSIFQSKKDIDNQIQQLNRSYEQATNYFKQTYKIEINNAALEVRRLEDSAKTKKQLQEKLQNKLTPLTTEKALTIFEYQRQKLLVEIDPDKQKIHDRLTELEKESRVYRRLVRDDIAWLSCQRTLDTVTEQNFREILKGVTPEQANELIKRQEHERIRPQQRIRYR